MRKNEVHRNDYTRLWLIDDDIKWYLYNTGVYRIMTRDYTKVILHTYSTYEARHLEIATSPFTLEILGGYSKKPHIYKEENIMFRLSNCTLGFKWIKRPITLTSTETAMITYAFEFKCDLEKLMEMED